jgi:hypothetical protein
MIGRAKTSARTARLKSGTKLALTQNGNPRRAETRRRFALVRPRSAPVHAQRFAATKVLRSRVFALPYLR